MLGYLFGEGTDTPTAQQLAEKRAQIEAMQARQLGSQPDNVGEGIRAIGSALFARIGDRRLAPREQAETQRSTDAFQQILSGLGGMPAAPIAAPLGGFGNANTLPPDAPRGQPIMPPQQPPMGAPVPPASGPAGGPLPPIAAPAAPPPLTEASMSSMNTPQATDWLAYANQGATRNQPLADPLVQALSFLPEMGVRMEVFSGGQPAAGDGPRVGSTRHDHGNAADVFFYDEATGRRLDWNNPADVPRFQEIVRRAREAGVTGFGAGEGYMQEGSMHIGFGPEAVWGADGSGANAAPWLVEALNGATGPNGTPAPTGGAPLTEASMSTMGGPTGGANMQIIMQLAELVQNPYLPEGQKLIAQMLIQQQMGQMFSEPMSELERVQLEQAQLDLEQDRNPVPEPTALPSSVAEYQFYVDQEQAAGRDPIPFAQWQNPVDPAEPPTSVAEYQFYAEQEQAAGRTPKSYERWSADPTPPAEPPTSVREYNFYADQETAAGRVPLSYAEFSVLEAEAGNPALVENQQGQRDIASDSIVNAANRALDAARNRMFDGMLGAGLSKIPSTDNAEVYRQVDVLKSNATLGTLQAMREASPTGGALGAVTAPELIILQDKIGALNPASPNFERDLADYTRTLLQTIHGPEAGNAIFQERYHGNAPPEDTGGDTVLTWNPETGDFE